MTNINETSPQKPVRPNVPDNAKTAKADDVVGTGLITDELLNVSTQEKRTKAKPALTEQHNLTKPLEFNPSQNELTNKQLKLLAEQTDIAIDNTKSLIGGIVNKELTPEQIKTLQQHAGELKSAAIFLDQLRGDQPVKSAKDKRVLLAGLGLNGFERGNAVELLKTEQPIELAKLHGGKEMLSQKQAALTELGYSEQQIKTILSLSNPDLAYNAPEALKKAAQSANGMMKALGFDESQQKQLTELINNKSVTDNQPQLSDTLSRLGFDNAQMPVIAALTNPNKVQQQAQLAKSADTGVSELLRANATGIEMLSKGDYFADSVVEQLVNMCAVIEVLFRVNSLNRLYEREARTLSYQAAREEILNQADEMRSAATAAAVGGWVSAGAKIAAGTTQVGLSVKAGNAPNPAAMQQQLNISSGITQIIGASGDMVKAGMDYQAGMHQALVKESEAEQRRHDNLAQSQTEFLNLYQDMVRTALSKMDEIIRSWFETLKSTTRG